MEEEWEEEEEEEAMAWSAGSMQRLGGGGSQSPSLLPGRTRLTLLTASRMSPPGEVDEDGAAVCMRGHNKGRDAGPETEEGADKQSKLAKRERGFRGMVGGVGTPYDTITLG